MYYQVLEKSTGVVLITTPSMKDALSFMSMYSTEEQKDMEVNPILKQDHPLKGGRK